MEKLVIWIWGFIVGVMLVFALADMTDGLALPNGKTIIIKESNSFIRRIESV